MHRRFLHASRPPSPRSCHGSRHRGASTWRGLRRECKLRNRISFLSSSGGSTTGHAMAWPRSKARILFRPNLDFGSRKALTVRVLAAKSWPHWLSGDTRLLARKASSIRWLYKTLPVGVSLRSFTAISSITARIQNTNRLFTGFPSANSHNCQKPHSTRSVGEKVRRERRWTSAVQLPPGNWFVPPGSNRNGSGGNEAVGAFDGKGR